MTGPRCLALLLLGSSPAGFIGCGGSNPPPASIAQAAPTPSRGESPPGAGNEQDLSAHAILERAEARCASIESYRCTSRVYVRLGDDTESVVLDQRFKRPGLFRNVVLEGDHPGGTVTRNADGVIHGKGGGILGIFVLTLDADDPRLCNMRGRPFYESSWHHEVADLRRATGAGYQLVRLADQEFDGTPCLVIAATGDGSEGGVTHYELWIERDSHLIRGRRDFEGETLVKDIRFLEQKINLDLPAELFSLK